MPSVQWRFDLTPTTGPQRELHPATDQWMSGDRWGTIIRKSKSSLMLRMDVSGRRIVVRPEHLKDFALPF